jgi:hypothetical protein
MLPMDDDAVINQWLAPSFHDVAAFDKLLEPVIRVNQVLTPIDKPSQWNANGEPFIIQAGSV